MPPSEILIGLSVPSTTLLVDGPKTGPLPALVIDDGHLEVSDHADVRVVVLDGGLDDRFVDAIADLLPQAVAGARAVVVDLDRVTLLHRGACVSLVRLVREAADGPLCVVASRLSGRVVLDRWGISDDLTVFGSVADALQVRTFAANGYGAGW